MKKFTGGGIIKTVAIITGILLVIMIVFAVFSGFSPPEDSALGAIVSPIQKVFSAAGDKFGGFTGVFSERDELKARNEELQKLLTEQVNRNVENDELKAQNEHYKNFLGIKEANPDWEFTPAVLISTDKSNPYRTFNIDMGSKDGISPYDPVITADGLVGYISEVSINYSTVCTILNPLIEFGAINSRTRDIGSAKGTFKLAEQGQILISNLKRDSAVGSGDIITTYGVAGVFPKGIIVGVVSDTMKADSDVSIDAVVKTAVDFDNISDVMVITGFEGQGAILK